MHRDFDDIWELLKAHQGEMFHTMRKLPFIYAIRGGEMFVNLKEKSITRATVALAYRHVMEQEGRVSGPKKLKVFGSCYLFPVFLAIGIINPDSVKHRKIHTPPRERSSSRHS